MHSLVLPESGRVKATVYDISGRRVKSLLDALVPAGNHDIEWNGTDDEGRSVSAGIYLIRVDTGGSTESRRVIVSR